MILSLGIALLLNQAIRGLTFYRTAILWPYGIALPVAGIIWMFMLHPSFGIIPYWLRDIIDFDFDWILKGDAADAAGYSYGNLDQPGIQCSVFLSWFTGHSHITH